MPLFRQKRHSQDRKKSGDATAPDPPIENNTRVPPTLPPPPPESTNGVLARAHPQSMIPSRKELLFHCQLAHGSATKQVKDFSNVKELYQKIVEAFDLNQNDIIFCTLNTHKVEMSSLLGAQIGLEDFIYAHIKGQPKQISVKKTEPSLGLTITDNGTGFAFVKRIREMSTISHFQEVCVGDLIVSINGRSMVGSRHYEVAKLLKDLPQFTDIAISLIEPRKAFDSIGPRSKGGASMATVMEGDTQKLEQALEKGEGRTTLKMKRDGQAVVEQVSEWEVRAADRVDDLLESFMGIRDTELAQAMVDMGKDTTNKAKFSSAMDEQLGEFEFPEEFVADVWTVIATARDT